MRRNIIMLGKQVGIHQLVAGGKVEMEHFLGNSQESKHFYKAVLRLQHPSLRLL